VSGSRNGKKPLDVTGDPVGTSAKCCEQPLTGGGIQ